MHCVRIIEKKRDGLELSREELEYLINGFISGEVHSYQMAAFAMAVYFSGMTDAETAALTDTMLRSGEVLVTSGIPLPKVDKHSTGGVGDKVSHVLAPLVACCDVAVPMISGRGLGITGGTLDKLEAIPGYRADLSSQELLSVVAECGCSISGQTQHLVPADHKLYALRDVTGTVPSIPLIVASIMSKKLAESIDGLVLDVKVGTAAFMKTLDHAHNLAASMVNIGRRLGVKCTALLTRMDEPIGRSVGNAVEIHEAVQVLRGEECSDLIELVLALGSHMLAAGGQGKDFEAHKRRLRSKLESGEGFLRFREMVALHSGDVSFIDSPDRLLMAPHVEEFPAQKSGIIGSVDARKIGEAAALLGCARMHKDDNLDYYAGFTRIKKRGESITRGGSLLYIHWSRSEHIKSVKKLLEEAFVIEDEEDNQNANTSSMIYQELRDPALS